MIDLGIKYVSPKMLADEYNVKEGLVLAMCREGYLETIEYKRDGYAIRWNANNRWLMDRVVEMRNTTPELGGIAGWLKHGKWIKSPHW